MTVVSGDTYAERAIAGTLSGRDDSSGKYDLDIASEGEVGTAVSAVQDDLDAHKADTAIHSSGRELGYAEITSNATATNPSPAVDVTGLSVTVTVGSRPIVIRVQGYLLTNSVATSGWNLIISEDNTTDFFVDACKSVDTAAGGKGAHGSIRRSPSAGTHTYKVKWSRVTSGDLTLFASATYPASIQVVEV